mgnify:CR=1 FL=1
MCLDLRMEKPPEDWDGKFYKVVEVLRDKQGNKSYWTGLFLHVEKVCLTPGVKAYNQFKRLLPCVDDFDEYISGFHCLLRLEDARLLLKDMKARIAYTGRGVMDYVLVEVLAEDLTFGRQNGWEAVSAQELTLIKEVE